jgi:rSAM/selenodomain-associated transferase 1
MGRMEKESTRSAAITIVRKYFEVRLSRTRICIFAKPPRAGLVKTRLAKTLGTHAAALLAQAMLDDTCSAMQALPWAEVVIASTSLFSPGLDVDVWLQGEGDLGQRIEWILRRALLSSHAAIAIGADSPGLPARLLDQTRSLLEQTDAVLGPAEDGGFYLLALKRCPEGLLNGIQWSHSTTCAETQARLVAAGCRVSVLDPWFDVDDDASFQRLRRELESENIVAPQTCALLERISSIDANVSRPPFCPAGGAQD